MSNPISDLLRDFLDRFGRAAAFANADRLSETLCLLDEQQRQAHAARARVRAQRRMARPLPRRGRAEAVIRTAALHQ